MATINEDLEELRRLKMDRDHRKEQFDTADHAFKQKQAEVFERMDEEKIDSMRVDGVNFVRSATAYGTVQDREAFVEWAREHDDGLVEYKERAALINELVRERIDNGEELPPGLGFYTRELIQQRAS